MKNYCHFVLALVPDRIALLYFTAFCLQPKRDDWRSDVISGTNLDPGPVAQQESLRCTVSCVSEWSKMDWQIVCMHVQVVHTPLELRLYTGWTFLVVIYESVIDSSLMHRQCNIHTQYFWTDMEWHDLIGANSAKHKYCTCKYTKKSLQWMMPTAYSLINYIQPQTKPIIIMQSPACHNHFPFTQSNICPS